MVQYTHKLVYNDLNRHTVKNILKQLRKLPWDTEEVKFTLFTLWAWPEALTKEIIIYLIVSLFSFTRHTQAQILDTFVKIHKGKYGNIHVVASLAAALSQYHDVMGTKLVDTLLRNIVNGLEVNLVCHTTVDAHARTDLIRNSISDLCSAAFLSIEPGFQVSAETRRRGEVSGRALQLPPHRIRHHLLRTLPST